MISNGVKNKRKLFAERATIKPNSNMNKVSQIENKNNNLEPQAYANKKRHYKRANTLNKIQYIFHFKGSENKLKEREIEKLKSELKTEKNNIENLNKKIRINT